MKKIFCLFLLLVMVISICACSSDDSTSGVTDEELGEVVTHIAAAEEAIVTISTLQITNWSTYENIMSYYFTNSANYNRAPYVETAKKIHEKKTLAISEMEKAKELMGTSSTGEYFDAVKEYYKTVETFLKLVSEFPEGYSKLTFSQAIADYKEKCQTAYSEVEFYQ